MSGISTIGRGSGDYFGEPQDKDYLTKKENDLIFSLYVETILNKKTPGMFRELYENGVKENFWDIDDVNSLEEKSLVTIDKELSLAGVTCFNLTDRGKKCAEERLKY
jgi:hypothetical protein